MIILIFFLLNDMIIKEQSKNLNHELSKLGDIEQLLFNESKRWKGNKSCREIADEIGLSPQRIYQIERKLINKLRKKKSLK